MSPAPEGTCSVTRGAFRTYSPYPSPGQAKGIKLLKPFGRDHWPVDSWLTLAGRWRLDRIGTMASSNAVLVRRQVRGAVSRNLRDPHRSHTNPEQGPSQWESSWAPGCPQGMWAGEIVGHVLMLTFSLLIVADACWFRGATKRART